MKAKKNWVFILLVILTYISVVIHTGIMALFAFNLFGFVDFYQGLISQYMGVSIEMTMDITLLCIESLIAVLFDLHCAKVYYRIYKYSALRNETYYRVGSQNLINSGIFQMLISSFPIGLIALITGIVLYKKQATLRETVTSDIPQYGSAMFSDYKLNAMSEAIGRLKELRAKGVISEEEYYEHLDKILES